MGKVERWILWLTGTVGHYERRTLADQLQLARQYVYRAHDKLLHEGLVFVLPAEPMPDWKSFDTLGQWEKACDALRGKYRRRLPNGRWTKGIAVGLTEAGKAKFREEFPGHEPK